MTSTSFVSKCCEEIWVRYEDLVKYLLLTVKIHKKGRYML